MVSVFWFLASGVGFSLVRQAGALQGSVGSVSLVYWAGWIVETGESSVTGCPPKTNNQKQGTGNRSGGMLPMKQPRAAETAKGIRSSSKDYHS